MVIVHCYVSSPEGMRLPGHSFHPPWHDMQASQRPRSLPQWILLAVNFPEAVLAVPCSTWRSDFLWKMLVVNHKDFVSLVTSSLGDPTSQGSTRFAQIHGQCRGHLQAMNDLHHYMFKETTVYKQVVNPTRLYVNNRRAYIFSDTLR